MSSRTRRTNKPRKSKARRPKRRPYNTAISRLTPGEVWTIPPRIRRSFRYTLLVTQTNAAAQYTNIQYNLSQPINLTGSANNVPCFTSFYNGATPGLYTAYRVQGFRVVARCANLDSTTSPRVLMCFTENTISANSLTTALTQNRYAAQGNSKDVILGQSTGNSTATISISTTLTKMFGTLNFNNNDTYSQWVVDATSYPPTTPVFLLVAIYSQAAMTNGVQIAYDFYFDVEFYQRSSVTS